ncbi:hypothetical protein MPSEU_000210400 [Mayamaea pseudoterrestris]|nr:hypothetical protein MPSEU_000210400 [Mayamaea pseudoterrestris]
MAALARHLQVCLILLSTPLTFGLSVKSSSFLGQSLVSTSRTAADAMDDDGRFGSHASLFMRKQKASDKRTRRKQRGILTNDEIIGPITVTESPMEVTGPWRGKTIQPKHFRGVAPSIKAVTKIGGRGRSRKRSTLYSSLSFYHNYFLKLLTLEYQVEEEEVLSRIKASLDSPLSLELSGYALFDMFPSRRGNLFSDEVYRLIKAFDAASVYHRDADYDVLPASAATNETNLPSNHRFSKNDVIMLTLQPSGSGDYYNQASLPTSDTAVTLEARVLNTGPTYVDIAVPAGKFEAAFGPAPNDRYNKGDSSMRLRMDRFFSKVPYERMVQALGQLTSISTRRKAEDLPSDSKVQPSDDKPNYLDSIVMDEVIRETILKTHAYANSESPLYGDADACDLEELANKIAKPPMRTSHKLATGALAFIDTRPDIFTKFNAPQRAAIEAALTRRLTMIQGPPGSGKTTVAAAIAFGYAKQCRAISPHTKVLACAFSNVGADNLAEAIQGLGLRVIRVGKASAIAESLWNITLDAAIDRDNDAISALRVASRATTAAAKLGASTTYGLGERSVKDAATNAVKEANRACNIAATKALREADIIISTSSGAADPRLLAACGITEKESDEFAPSQFAAVKDEQRTVRELAPDAKPPLSLPFVLIDEACQSVEPATIIPVLSSNSCRSLVLLGDPCQLPPTVRSHDASSLSLSLMERLSIVMPKPTVISSRVDTTISDTSYMDTLAVKQSKSLMRSMESSPNNISYRKRFGGAMLLSVQYRMHPSISAFPSAVFYDGLLATPAFLSPLRPFPAVLKSLMPNGNFLVQNIRIINVGGRGNERQGLLKDSSLAPSSMEQTSYWNEREGLRVVSLLKKLLQGEIKNIETVGIISPYNGQVQLIKSIMADDKDLRDLLDEVSISVEVNSVDGYQGRERDVIIFSSVRSNRHGRIGFLHDWRRMNVAMTRAKSAFLFVGDLETLSIDKHWAAFAKYARGLDIVFF